MDGSEPVEAPGGAHFPLRERTRADASEDHIALFDLERWMLGERWIEELLPSDVLFPTSEDPVPSRPRAELHRALRVPRHPAENFFQDISIHLYHVDTSISLTLCTPKQPIRLSKSNKPIETHSNECSCGHSKFSLAVKYNTRQ
jgi:hypothetical protein